MKRSLAQKMKIKVIIIVSYITAQAMQRQAFYAGVLLTCLLTYCLDVKRMLPPNADVFLPSL